MTKKNHNADMERRSFVKQAGYLGLGLIFAPYISSAKKKTSPAPPPDNQKIFNRLMNTAEKNNWKSLKIGELTAEVGRYFIGTPYVANTLEPVGSEKCVIDLSGLDCVTFFENSLCIARIIKKGKTELNDLYSEITFTRYRTGKLTDYTSRLHYTTEWLSDNEKKGVIKNITKDIGGEPLNINVGFMSNNPGLYTQLKNNPEFVEKINTIEGQINSGKYYYISKSKVAAVESKLQSGDIIAIATSKKGLDYSHTGMIFRDEKVGARFLHASLKEKSVMLDTRISSYLQNSATNIGISIGRPLDT
jgi:hypothetical protein